MSKFVVVRKAPEALRKGEAVISTPDFKEQIALNAHRASKKMQTSLHHMREILNSIQQKYESDLNILKIPLAQYEGLAYENADDLNTIVVNLLKKLRPEFFDAVLEYNIKNRPYGTKLVYYVGDLGETSAFFKHGVDMIEEKDVDEYLGLKPKKQVGKPAVTKEQSLESEG